MIDLIKKFDKHEKTITDFVLSRKKAYFSHNCYLLLKRRHQRLNAAIDMKSPVTQNNIFQSKIPFPYVREQFIMRRAITMKNFRNDPLFTIDPDNSTSMESANLMQDTLTSNIRKTRFRQKTFNPAVDMTSRMGSQVIFTQPVREIKMGWRTVPTPDGLSPTTRQFVPLENASNIKNFNIHPLNYFQDPEENDSEESSIRGFIDSLSMDRLINNLKQNPQNYIKKNATEVIESGKKFAIKDADKWDDRHGKNSSHNEAMDFSHVKSDMIRVWTTLPIKGNEDDGTIYYIELMNDKIIRIMVNDLDFNIVPLTCGTYRIRQDYWWGNTPVEDVQPWENFITLIMNMKADQALRMMDNMVFMPKSFGIDIADFNNRHTNGGIVRYDDKEGLDIRKVAFPWAPVDNSTGNTDWLLREGKEAMGRINPTPDLSRGYNQGGLNNKTATAASIESDQGDTLQSDMLEVYGYSWTEVARKTAIMIQQFANDEFSIRPNVKEPQRIVNKTEILGDFTERIVSSLSKNKITEFARLHNLLTGIANFKGTPDQTWQNVQTLPIIEKYLQTADIGDIDSILQEPQQMPQQIPGQLPQPQQVMA